MDGTKCNDCPHKNPTEFDCFDCPPPEVREKQKQVPSGSLDGCIATRFEMPHTVGDLKKLLDPYTDEMEILWHQGSEPKNAFYLLRNGEGALLI